LSNAPLALRQFKLAGKCTQKKYSSKNPEAFSPANSRNSKAPPVR
jgi:hypothetical protein